MSNGEVTQLTSWQVMVLTTLFQRVLLHPDAIEEILSVSPNKSLVNAGIPEGEVEQVAKFLIHLKGKVDSAIVNSGDHWAGSN